MEIETQFSEEIVRELEELKEMEVGTDKYRTTVDGLTKLADRAIEIVKLNKELELKEKTQTFEVEKFNKDHELKVRDVDLKEKDINLKEKDIELKGKDVELKEKDLDVKDRDRAVDVNFKTRELESEDRDRLIRNCLTAAGIIIPVLVTIWGTHKSFEFEKEGTITTIMGRGFINKLLPKK